jgi:hypothetical protein
MNEQILKPGMLVNYHGIIGGDITSTSHKIKSIEFEPNNYQQDVAWITGKSGCVALAALSAMRPGKSVFLTTVREYVDSGLGYDDLVKSGQISSLTGRYILDHVEREWRRDLASIPAMLEGMQLVAFRAVQGDGGEHLICDTMIDGLVQELEERIRQEFREALQGVYDDQEERGADRSMAEGC